MPTTMSQVNARIDASLKQKGDEALAEAGLTPTQAVRALWELAARYASQPETLASILEPEAADEAERARMERRKQVAKAIDAGDQLMHDACKEAGIAWPPRPDNRTYEQIEKDAYAEAYGNQMGWGA